MTLSPSNRFALFFANVVYVYFCCTYLLPSYNLALDFHTCLLDVDDLARFTQVQISHGCHSSTSSDYLRLTRNFCHFMQRLAMPDDQVAPSDAPTDPKPIIRLKESVINKIAAGEVPFRS